MCLFVFPNNLFWWTWKQYCLTSPCYVLYVFSLYCALLQNSLVPWTKGKEGLFVTRYFLADGTVMTGGHCGHSLEQEESSVSWMWIQNMSDFFLCVCVYASLTLLEMLFLTVRYFLIHTTPFVIQRFIKKINEKKNQQFSVNHLHIQQLVIITACFWEKSSV